jgi:hypothetical protein
MRRPPRPTFPDWLPDAVRLQASELWERLPTEQDPAKAQQILERLIADLQMKRVWDELYRKQRIPEDIYNKFVNPACLTNASQAAAFRKMAQTLRKKGGERNKEDAGFLDFEARVIESLPEDPAPPDWNEQDCAAQVFFTRAYEIALKHDPVMQAKVDKLQHIAERLRELAGELKLMDTILTRRYAEKLKEVAADCDDDAKITRPNLAKPTRRWLGRLPRIYRP